MGFPNRKRDRDEDRDDDREERRGGGRKGGRRGGKRESNYKNVGGAWESKENPDYLYISLDDYNGSIVYVDEETGESYKLKFISLFTPKKSKKSRKPLPKGLLYNLAVNLANEDAAIPVDLEDAE